MPATTVGTRRFAPVVMGSMPVLQKIRDVRRCAGVGEQTEAHAPSTVIHGEKISLLRVLGPGHVWAEHAEHSLVPWLSWQGHCDGLAASSIACATTAP